MKKFFSILMLSVLTLTFVVASVSAKQDNQQKVTNDSSIITLSDPNW